jgi:hypothetical protein
MTKYGPAIQLCKAREYVCQQVFLIFQISGVLGPAVNELKESFFVCF